MINGILLRIARFSIGKKLIAALADVSDKLNGKKTGIILGLEIAIYVLELLGVIDGQLADTLKVALLGALPTALADRARKIQDQIDTVLAK